MESSVETSEGAPASEPWTGILDRHRARWLDELVGERELVDLAAVPDPAAALADAGPQRAFVWFDDGDDPEAEARVLAALAQAPGDGSPIVLGFEPDSAGSAQRRAEAAVRQLGGARMVTQELAAGSLISSAPDEPERRRRSVRLLVCANVGPLDEDGRLAAHVEPLMAGYVAWLDQANRELRSANARLGRERIGQHDSAAAAVIDRRERLEGRVAELEAELERVRKEARQTQELLYAELQDRERTLAAPRYRTVDRVRALAFGVPGVSLALRLRSRRIKGRSKG